MAALHERFFICSLKAGRFPSSYPKSESHLDYEIRKALKDYKTVARITTPALKRTVLEHGIMKLDT